MNSVWRINLKSSSEESVDPRKFCFDRQILGIGWAVFFDGQLDWDTYYKLALEKYYNEGDNGWWPAINALKNRMSINDLCWTRDWDGVYYSGRIKSDWYYKNEEEFISANVVNIRDCNWLKIGTVDLIPGKIVNSFIPARTVQRIHDPMILVYSQFLYNSLASDFHYEIHPVQIDLFSLFSYEDCEDIIGIYLQDQGYHIIPSSCKSDTAAYEYVLIHKETSEKAVAQVKSGNVNLNINNYSSIPCKVFLFTSRGEYFGNQAENVVCISLDEVKHFLTNRKRILPERILSWIKISEFLGKENA